MFSLSGDNWNGWRVVVKRSSEYQREVAKIIKDIIISNLWQLSPAIILFDLHFLEICICVFRYSFAWRSIYYKRKMKVNNSEVECLTISLRGLIHDGESNMHIKHISRLFILLQTRLKEPAEHSIVLILLFRFCFSYNQQVLPHLENLI